MSQTELPRNDPRPRTVDGAPSGAVINMRPDRVYCGANPNNVETGVEALLSLGWVPISRKSDKERIKGGPGASEGVDTVSWQGQILMWRPVEMQEAHEQKKADEARRYETKIESRGGIEQVRGYGGRLAGPVPVNQATQD
jgi:hypothetical protein